MSDITFVDLAAAYDAYKEQFDAAYARVMSRGWFILGPECEAFERAFAAWHATNFCIGVANGTDAVELALAGVGVMPGDEVATVSHTAVATVAAIERLGAVPVLVDVEPSRYTMCPRSLAAVMETRPVKAVVPVHLYGQCADMLPILELAKKYGAFVVEDCAQAHGATLNGKKAGTFGDAAAFSFYPTKNLGAFGDGGAVLTSHEDVAARIRALRQYGWKKRYISDERGCNSRLDELQSAFLRVRLSGLQTENGLRVSHAQAYRAGLEGCPGLTLAPPIPECGHVYHLFVVEVEDRNACAAYLAQSGIATAVHYPQAVHRQPAYDGRVALAPGGLPQTERLVPRLLSLPMHPWLRADAICSVCERLREWRR